MRIHHLLKAVKDMEAAKKIIDSCNNLQGEEKYVSMALSKSIKDIRSGVDELEITCK